MKGERFIVGLVALCVMTFLAGCGEPPPPSSGIGGNGASPKQVCLQANQAQRDATKLENDIRAGTDADANAYLDEARALGQTLASLLANGSSSGAVNDDLSNALSPVMRIESDLLKPDLAQAQADAETLRNAMIQLAMDCSSYLS
jgi:hypothetical protein